MILTLDIGTSSVKGALFDDEGRCRCSRLAEISMGVYDDPAIHEVEATDWIDAVRGICAALLDPGDPPEAVSISGNGPTVVPVDAGGRPLHPALTWMDRRAVVEAELVGEAAGFPIDSSFFLPKVLWFRRVRPEIYEGAAAFLSCPEFLGTVLTGESCMIVPLGYEKYYGDAAMLAALDLDQEKFPRSVRPGGLAGVVGKAGEAATGIPRGTKVILSGPDFLSSLVGTATTVPGRACDRAGTSEGINLCSAMGVSDPRLLSVPHVIEPYANVSGTISASGKAVDWFKRASGRGKEGYEDFFEDICRSPPGSGKLIFLPYLTGERAPLWDPSARGVFLGLNLAHGRKEMSRAVVESTAFAMRDVIEVMESAGAHVSELRITGNPGKSPVWNQIKADVTYRPIALPACKEAELLGNLCFAFAALGRSPSPADAAEKLVRVGKIYEPDPATRHLYDELFAVYRAAYAALKDVFKRLERTPSIERSLV